MKSLVRSLVLPALLLGLATTGCSAERKYAKDENYIPHSAYGGCHLQGRHFHNTHVYIGDIYSPSLTEWTKY